MFKVGLICASDEELAPFLPHIENCVTTEKAMLTFYEGSIGSAGCYTVQRSLQGQCCDCSTNTD